MPSLNLVDAAAGCKGHEGEVCTCAFTPDGGHVLSGGWDKHLRIWETQSGRPVAAIEAGRKPISACAVSPDGRYFFSGCLEGLLARWDAHSHRRVSMFLAHGRPVSSIIFAMGSRAVITSSWDTNLIIWDLTREFEGTTLSGHRDIVAGCKLTPDGQTIISWSYDGTLILWSMVRRDSFGSLAGHQDRVTAADVSPDGQLAVSGSRDGSLKLWDMHTGNEVASVDLAGEVCKCFFFRHGKSLAALSSDGRLTLRSCEDLAELDNLQTDLSIVCADLAPAGDRIVLGCADGRIRFVEVKEFDRFPLIVTLTKTSKRTSTRLQRMLGRSRMVQAYVCSCPACRRSIELQQPDPAQALTCPGCRRSLRIADVVQAAATERPLTPVAR